MDTPSPDSISLAQAVTEVLRMPLDQMPDPLPLCPLPGPFFAEVCPPGSKSMTNRLLVLAALAGGESVIRRPLVDADDVRVMMRGLAQLGADVLLREDDDGTACVLVSGVGGQPLGNVKLSLENSGTSVRFLAALGALANGPVTIDGNARMRQRPVDELVTALRGLQVRVENLGEHGFPPIRVHGVEDVVFHGGRVTFDSPASSQFISALLMIGPWTEQGIDVTITGEVTSSSYIQMTVGLMKQLGADVEHVHDFSRIHIKPVPIEPFEITVEPDASGATYFWGAAALSPDSVCRIPHVSPVSWQGDARFVNTLGAMGAIPEIMDDAILVEAPRPDRPLRGVGVDCSNMPDAAMTLACCCVFAQGPSVLTGLRTLRDKECDRIEATKTELEKIGAVVEASGSGMRIVPPETWTDVPVEFDTYDDHRMAMALSLVGLRRPNVFIRNPSCVAKTYPGYWSDLARVYEAAL
ncbi:MAG: 3-phosphoshikimate 1-carboxyvinyltransferase [Planctomycetota bacterium]|jgi:3-phosphoshikimate 1-carboxyvinyltransferase